MIIKLIYSTNEEELRTITCSIEPKEHFNTRFYKSKHFNESRFNGYKTNIVRKYPLYNHVLFSVQYWERINTRFFSLQNKINCYGSVLSYVFKYTFSPNPNLPNISMWLPNELSKYLARNILYTLYIIARLHASTCHNYYAYMQDIRSM